MMRRLLLFVAAIATTMVAGAQKSTVKCTLNGLDKDYRIVVAEARDGRMVPTDTLTPDDKGRFSLSRQVAGPQLLTFSLDKPNSPLVYVMLMPKENISITADYMPTLNHIDIRESKGSENVALFKEFTNLITRTRLYTPEIPFEQSLDSLLNARSNVLMSAVLVTYFERDFEQHAAIYRTVRDALIGRWPDNEFVAHLDTRLRSTLLPGMEAPDIVLPDRNGENRSLHSLRGKVVLIDFWASWCRPCRMENPNVVRLYNEYHDQGFEIFSVSLDNNRDAWLKAIADDHLDWPNHVSDLRGWSSAGSKLYGVQAIPSTVLVDADGIIVARNLRGADLEKKLKEIFAQ